MTKDELIELFDEAIGNAKCIGRLDGMWQGRGPWPEQDYRGMVALEQANSSKRKSLSDALAAADKRIAELEAKIDEAYRKGYATGEEEAEHKLSVARGACKDIRRAIERECYAAAYIIVSEALAQIGGEV